MLKLSFVVPMYNAESYLADCLDSLLSQDIDQHEYEVVCVDDGSTDRTAELANRYATENPNIVVFRQENRGVSAARNAGTSLARGEYVWYVDADDYISARCAGYVINVMEATQADACVVAMDSVRSDSVFTSTLQVYSVAIDDGITEWPACAGQVIVSRWLLRKHDISFNEALAYGEDVLWVYHVRQHAERLCRCKEPLYHYRQHSQSAMHDRSSAGIRGHQESLLRLASIYRAEELKELSAHERRHLRARRSLAVQGALFSLCRNETDFRRVRGLCHDLTADGMYPYPILKRPGFDGGSSARIP